MLNNTHRIALVISTFNWPEALHLVLQSLLRQSRMPDEILIADDGSDESTRQLVQAFQQRFSVPLRHFWQERNGFQKTTILNKAIGGTQCDYIVQMDGDIIAHPSFVQDHANLAEPGYYVRGSRTLLGEPVTKHMINARELRPIRPLSKGIKNRINAVHHPGISKLLTRYQKKSGNVHGCNLAFWRHDFVAANGYDNRFKGWGHEDIELAARFVNNDILQKKVKMKAVCYHLNHPLVKRSEAERNFTWYLETVTLGLRRCADGYDQQEADEYETTLGYLPAIQTKG